MKFNNIDIDIIVRYLNGDCSLDEEEKLNSWLEEDPDNEELLLFIRKIWDTSTGKKKFDDVNAAWTMTKSLVLCHRHHIGSKP